MGTNVYMRRIPTADQKEELKRLLKKQCEEAIESILQFLHQDGWTGESYDRWKREQGHYYPVSVASYEHVIAAGLRFARDADFC